MVTMSQKEFQRVKVIENAAGGGGGGGEGPPPPPFCGGRGGRGETPPQTPSLSWGGGGGGRPQALPPAAFERASGAAAETPLSTRFLELGAAWQSWTRHAVGGFCSPEAVDLDLGPGQVSGLQRFSSGGKTSQRREPHRQP